MAECPLCGKRLIEDQRHECALTPAQEVALTTDQPGLFDQPEEDA